MAEVYRRVGGRKLAKLIATLDGVQGELDDRTLQIGTRAEALLAEHRADGHARIEVEAGDVDRYVVLSDERGQKAAMSIEYGRQPGRYTDEDGVEHEIGAMDGLFILHRAAHLRARQKRETGGAT